MAKSTEQLSLREIQQTCALPGAVVSAQLLRRLRRDPRPGAQKLYRVLSRRSEAQQSERRRLEAMLHFEQVLWKAGIARIAGVDEVGIGPLAGPVVAAAVVFPPGTWIDGIDDSKALDEATRCRLEMEIRQKAVSVGIGVVAVDEIDRINVYQAGIRSMQLALSDLSVSPQHVLVDSRTIPDIVPPQNSFDKGDGINFSIAAASIVAKVYRDRLMTDLDQSYPGYGFGSHKGYATPEHQAAIRRLGPCEIHRKSFDYIRELCGHYADLFYRLKAQGGCIASRPELLNWEKQLRDSSPQLSAMENKKLHLMATRLWKRIR